MIDEVRLHQLELRGGAKGWPRLLEQIPRDRCIHLIDASAVAPAVALVCAGMKPNERAPDAPRIVCRTIIGGERVRAVVAVDAD